MYLDTVVLDVGKPGWFGAVEPLTPSRCWLTEWLGWVQTHEQTDTA